MNVLRPKLLRVRLRHCAQPSPPRRRTGALRARGAVARGRAIAGRSSACFKFETVGALAGARAARSAYRTLSVRLACLGAARLGRVGLRLDADVSPRPNDSRFENRRPGARRRGGDSRSG